MRRLGAAERTETSGQKTPHLSHQDHLNTEQRRHAHCVSRVPRHDAVRHGLAAGDDRLRASHVEGDGVHRLQHRGGADHLGRAVDVLRGSEHRADAVQSARLAAGSDAGPADGARPHRHLRRAGGRGAHGDGGRRAVHQLPPGGDGEGEGGARRRGHLHHERAVRAGAAVLDGQQHHRGLLRPAGAPVQEEGDRSRHLHRLGRHRAAAAGRHPAVLLLLSGRQRSLPHQIRAHQDDHIQRGQEVLRLRTETFEMGGQRQNFSVCQEMLVPVLRRSSGDMMSPVWSVCVMNHGYKHS